ncbi:hypothetical protein AL036_09260 [Salipiger aestuarii]|uniref:Sulfotransferase family protein n=1 Tax=Salipiger aestuarii TaxID=568098 RepID=A0A327XYM5_9RHOB|nr:sulfotransferase family protein [Salipiger aestuarii]EIE49408.1 hypothetical protein C357_19151 [Citreicella sp. 357]KAA8607811.1 hypothetical protein AL036_09260 [Salipiger aestuarii]KAA8610486.1 hypothetical protein AL037_13335 [Salipiger aestuarii]KAB2541108.1 hypothetical protein AL035_14145 [Salipiger aestuarii]RAK13312.1 hypothetical protein ATI53_103614 [Salipiger aestuarii]
MTKTLILHIGHYKTGTTALQVFAVENRRFLAEHGVDYPKVWHNRAKHSALLFSILRQIGVTKLMHGYANTVSPHKVWGDMFKHIESSPYPVTLVSSEEFMRIGQFPAAQALLGEILATRPAGLTVRAVVYLRDPASHLRSWYNQLIKMNRHVADLNTALNGDIEDIHFDYRRAVAPWCRLLGAENVDVRPYSFDRNNPAALHDDFFGSVGVTLTDATRVVKEQNPRLDDRVSELVRLMQNLDLPQGTIGAIRRQALAYMAAQDEQVVTPGSGVPSARARAASSIDWLKTLPNCNLPLDRFAENLPEPMSQEEINRNLLLGFVFSEFIQLRKKVNKADLTGMHERLSRLEAALGQTAQGRPPLF